LSEFVEKYEFEKVPDQIEYLEGEPLKLTKEFRFYHNKVKFRKELNSLQKLFQNYTQHPLIAAGIRGSYLKEEYFKDYLIVLFVTPDKIKNASDIVEKFLEGQELKEGCFLMENSSESLALISKDMDGVKIGIDYMQVILKQTLEHYLQQKDFDKFIKVRPFRIFHCPS
jgi:hypothetical protein